MVASSVARTRVRVLILVQDLSTRSKRTVARQFEEQKKHTHFSHAYLYNNLPNFFIKPLTYRETKQKNSLLNGDRTPCVFLKKICLSNCMLCYVNLIVFFSIKTISIFLIYFKRHCTNSNPGLLHRGTDSVNRQIESQKATTR